MSDEEKHERAVEAAMKLCERSDELTNGCPVNDMSDDETLMVLARGLQGLSRAEVEVSFDEEGVKKIKSGLAKVAEEFENFFEQTKDEARTNELTEKHREIVGNLCMASGQALQKLHEKHENQAPRLRTIATSTAGFAPYMLTR